MVSDSETDAFVGVTAVLFLAVATSAAASGNPLTSSSGGQTVTGTSRASSTTRPVSTPQPRSTTNIPAVAWMAAPVR